MLTFRVPNVPLEQIADSAGFEWKLGAWWGGITYPTRLLALSRRFEMQPAILRVERDITTLRRLALAAEPVLRAVDAVLRGEEGKETDPVYAFGRLDDGQQHKELQDPETGEVLHTPRKMPSAAWKAMTMTKYKHNKRSDQTKAYKDRKYRCAGRVNRVGSCTMPKLSADALEKAVLDAVFSEARRTAPEQLVAKLHNAAARRRVELEAALDTLCGEMRDSAERRDNVLDALTDRRLSPVLRDAMARRAEDAVRAYEEMEQQQRTLQAGLEALAVQLRNVATILTTPLLNPERWLEPAINQVLKRALHLLVHRAELQEERRGRYRVKLWLYKTEFLLVRESVTSESAWESNPPAKLVTPPTYFEDKDDHRAASTLGLIVGAEQRTVKKRRARHQGSLRASRHILRVTCTCR